MKRGLSWIACVVGTLVPASALAQQETPDLPPASPPTPPPQPSDLLVPTPPEWKILYDEARAKLITGDFADAAVRFAELERSAVNRTDRALAQAQGSLANDWAKRSLAFVHQKDLGESNASAKAVDKRTTDELVSIYTNAVFYGLGSGLWVATLTQPKTAATVVLPALALTAASVGTVVALDSGRGFHYGIPQSIVSGMYIGLEEGIVWGTFWSAKQHGSLSNDDARTEAMIIWGLTTGGAIGGGVLGATLGTTPGRSAWVGSTTLWAGTLFGFTTGAFTKSFHATDDALLGAGIGGTIGIGVGLGTASLVSPSIARVRFLDLGGLSGSLLGAGLYAAAAGNAIDSHATSGFTAIGGALGLGTAWALTASMPEDRLRTSDDPAPPTSALMKMRPMLLPAKGGAMMGVGGELD